MVNYLNAIGIRVKLRPIERAAFQKGWAEKQYRGLIQGGNGSFGNAATRIESLVEESGIGLVAGYIFSAPYEDVKLKSK